MRFLAIAILIFTLLTPSVYAALDFDQALNQIVSRSTSVAIQDANLNATHARNLPVRLSFVPSLSLEAKHIETRTVAVNNTPLSFRQVEGVAQLNIFKFGADYAAIQAANHFEDQQRFLLDESVLRAEESGVRALVARTQRQKEVATLTEILKIQKDLLDIARQRYASGYLPLQEVDKVSVDLDNAGSRLADGQVRAIDAMTTLEGLLGHSDIVANWPWKDRFGSALAQSEALVTDPTSLLSSRPDWRAAQSRVEAQDRRVSQAWRQMYPSLDASFSYGYISLGTTQWTGSVGATLPLFDRLLNYSSAKAESYMRSAADASLEQVRRDAKVDWESARLTFQTSLHSALTRDRTLVTSRRLYQDNLKRFQGGRASANDLALDRGRLFDSELLAIQGWAAVHVAYARYCHSRGLRIASCR